MVRPMHLDDVESAERLRARGGSRNDTHPQWRRLTEHLLGTDPAGAWVAEVGTELVGFASSCRRDLLWILASHAVAPDADRQGVGAALLGAALTHSRGCLRGMLSATADPLDFRRFRSAGFDLHPQMRLQGVVDRSSLPVVEHVHEGTAGDVHLLDSLDRRLRDAAHGVDHSLLRESCALLVTDRPAGSGYAYVDGRGQVVLLAATHRRTAADLLWQGLALTAPGTEVSLEHVTAANHWAIDVGLAAGLEVSTSGYLGLRGMKPPSPYLHHGRLL